MLHAVACRMAFTLRGHISTETESLGGIITIEERRTRHIRRLFWHCYIFDNDIALRIGQPPIISETQCDLTLPIAYDERHFFPNLSLSASALISFANTDQILEPSLPGELRLSRLKHKTCELLYSAHALSKSNVELIRAILALDNELEQWRLSVPPEFRPSLSISNTKRRFPNHGMPQVMQHITLHLEYHYLIVKIHQASARCGAWELIFNKDCRAVVSSSMALCLEASRSTLFYLTAAMDQRVHDAFW